MDELRKQYLDQYIISIKNGTPINFPLDNDLVKNDRDFAVFKVRVSEIYKDYTDFKGKNDTTDKVFLKYLIMYLKKYKGKANTDADTYAIMKYLYQQLDFPTLDAGLQNKFNEAIFFFEKSIDYFCSYTTKGLPEINSSYEDVVSGVFGIDRKVEAEAWKKMNYVAKLIVRYLNNLNFNNYFFDVDNIVNGDELEEKVFDYCKRTMVFVILAQQENFWDKKKIEENTSAADKNKKKMRNWCFEEYVEYQKSRGGNCQYLIYRVPDLIRPSDGTDEDILKYFDQVTDKTRGTTFEYEWSMHKIKQVVTNDAETITLAGKKYFDKFLSEI